VLVVFFLSFFYLLFTIYCLYFSALVANKDIFILVMLSEERDMCVCVCVCGRTWTCMMKTTTVTKVAAVTMTRTPTTTATVTSTRPLESCTAANQSSTTTQPINTSYSAAPGTRPTPPDQLWYSKTAHHATAYLPNWCLTPIVVRQDDTGLSSQTFFIHRLYIFSGLQKMHMK